MTNIKLYFSILLAVIASLLFIGSLNISKLNKVNVIEIGKKLINGNIKEYSLEKAKNYSCTLEDPKEKTIILRLDDITSWNNLDLMKEMVKEVDSRGYGVTLGVIPDRLEGSYGLIKWLQDIKDKENIELSQHGYKHTENEFKTLSYEDAKKKIELGRKIMMGYFGQIPINFIPPYNVDSEGTIQALKDLGFKTFSGSVNEYKIDGNFAKAGYTVTTYKYSEDRFINADQVLRECKASLDKNGVCVLMMHPQDFTEEGEAEKEKYAELIKVLDGLKNLNAQVVNFKQAFCKEY